MGIRQIKKSYISCVGYFRFNEKFGCVKTQANYDTIGVKEGLFTNDCKKTLKLVQNAIKIMYKNEV
jgi:hypothetical protein